MVSGGTLKIWKVFCAQNWTPWLVSDIPKIQPHFIHLGFCSPIINKYQEGQWSSVMINLWPPLWLSYTHPFPSGRFRLSVLDYEILKDHQDIWSTFYPPWLVQSVWYRVGDQKIGSLYKGYLHGFLQVITQKCDKTNGDMIGNWLLIKRNDESPVMAMVCRILSTSQVLCWNFAWMIQLCPPQQCRREVMLLFPPYRWGSWSRREKVTWPKTKSL